MPKDSNGNPLEPGALYCLALDDFDGGVEYGRLVWFASDGHFYDADDDGEIVLDEFDALVRQIGPSLNPEYIWEAA